MALSKRFADITPVTVPESQDDDDAYDDEILQRLLKKTTNYSKIVPSKLDFQPCRDDLVSVGVSDNEEEEELGEDWADDFRSLLKSCENKKDNVNIPEKNCVEKPVTSSEKSNNRLIPVKCNGKENSVIAGQVKHIPEASTSNGNNLSGRQSETGLEKSHDAEYDTENVTAAEIESCLHNKKNESIETNKVTICDADETVGSENLQAESRFNSKTRIVSPKLESKMSSEKIENKEVFDTKSEKLVHSKICDDKVEKNRHVFEISGRKVSATINLSDSSLPETANHKSEKSKNSNKNANFGEKAGIINDDVCGNSKSDSDEIMKGQEQWSEKNEQIIQNKSYPSIPTKDQIQADKGFIDIFCQTAQNKKGHKDDQALVKERNKNTLLPKSNSELTSKSRNKEAKKSRPLVIREATSFPLDELLPSPVPCKKPRTSLDSNINNIRESPVCARKRHKSEMITSHQQITSSAKKQKVNVEQRFTNNTCINKADMNKNPSGSVSYIPEDIASLLSAIDTNQSLLTFFRKQLHTETGTCNVPLNKKVDNSSPSLPFGFYTQRKEESFHLNKNQDSNDSEELFHLLVQQCSELVKTEEDRSKLQSLVNLLKSESGTDFTRIGFTPVLGNERSPPPPSPSSKSPPSPFSPKSKLCTTQTFEGRTLLKGGVQPRHIPKNFLAKTGKRKPTDPRNYADSRKGLLVLPLPKFAKEFWEKEKIRQLRKKNLSIKDDFKSRNSKLDPSPKEVGMKEEGPDAWDFETNQQNLAGHDKVHGRTMSDDSCLHEFGILDENQNLLKDNEKETVTGLSSCEGVQDSRFYAAVADIFNCDDEFVQPKKHSRTGDYIETCADLEMKNASSIPVLINGVEVIHNECKNISVLTAHKTHATKHTQPYHSSALHIDTSKTICSSSNSTAPELGFHTGPSVGIVKPMPLNTQNELMICNDHSADVDTRNVSMELNSDTEEGEIDYRQEDKTIAKKSVRGTTISSEKQKEQKKRLLDRLKKDDIHTTNDDSSSCSSASSRGRIHRRSWRRGHSDYRSDHNRHPRSRHSSCSSVDSKSSDRSYSDRQRYHWSSHSHKSHHNRHSDSRSYCRQESKSNNPDRHRSGRSDFGHRLTERKSTSNERSHCAYTETEKVLYGDKRHVKKGKQPSKVEVVYATGLKNTKPKTPVDTSDSEEEQFLLDYKEKYGRSSSSHANIDTCTESNTKLNSKLLPDCFKADREFLNYSLKKMEMVNKVKHDYISGPVLVKSPENPEEGDRQTKMIMKKKNNNQITTMRGKKTGSCYSDSAGSGERQKAAADGSGCFKNSDMFSLADLEEVESFMFKSKKEGNS